MDELLSRYWIPFAFIVISIPLILEKIRPNKFYGIRLKKTLSNDKIWYKANKHCGWCFLITGIVLLVFRFIDPYFNMLQEYYKVIVFISIIIASLVSFIYTYKIKV